MLDQRSTTIAMVTLAGLLALGGATGCSRSFIGLSSSSYAPKFQAAEFSDYRGKEVYMPGFANRAENTSVFYYYSTDGNRRYGGPLLASYFWYCFKSAFTHIGVKVYDGGAPASVPKLDVEFPSLTDAEFQFTVSLEGQGVPPFRKTYKVAAPPPQSDDLSYLAERAYAMNDLAFTTIAWDPEFRAAFMRAQPRAAQAQPAAVTAPSAPSAQPSALPPPPPPPPTGW
jgi:hypothetical protein